MIHTSVQYGDRCAFAERRVFYHVFCSACVLLCLLLSGCISSKVIRYEEVPVSSISSSRQFLPVVDVRHTNRSYAVIGCVEIKASDFYSAEKIVQKLRKKAALLNGDAISDVCQEPLAEHFPYFFDYLNLYQYRWSAEVIQWRDSLE